MHQIQVALNTRYTLPRQRRVAVAQRAAESASSSAQARCSVWAGLHLLQCCLQGVRLYAQGLHDVEEHLCLLHGAAWRRRGRRLALLHGVMSASTDRAARTQQMCLQGEKRRHTKAFLRHTRACVSAGGSSREVTRRPPTGGLGPYTHDVGGDRDRAPLPNVAFPVVGRSLDTRGTLAGRLECELSGLATALLR